MSEELVTLKVPDLGGFDRVEVIEVLVSKGDRVEQEDPLITLESDKAAMDIPAERAGVVEEVLIKTGDQVGPGEAILKLRPSDSTQKRDSAQNEPDPQDGETQTDEPPQENPSSQETARTEAPKEPSKASPAPEGAVDLLVLGGGPGGYTAAFRAADLGLSVVLVEERPKLGGVCLNVGCIPTKALLHAARVAEQSQAASTLGLAFEPPKIDFKKLQQWKQGVVTQLVDGLGQLAQQRKVEVITGRGRFTGPHELAVQGEQNQTLHFKQAILATGSRPVKLPDLPESERILDSTGALALEALPKSLLIVGGGVIGVEFASLFSALGTQVHLVEQAGQLLPGVDPALAQGLQKSFKSRLEGLHLNSSLQSVQEESGLLKAQIEGLDQPLEVERVLVAVGRRPNCEDLGLEALGLAPNDRGQIEVDPQQRTVIEHLFAIGDLTPGPQLAHKATAEAKVAAEVIAGKKAAWDHRAIPAVAYTEPEVAWVGLSEAQAKEEGREVEVHSFPWSASGRALAEQASEGFTRLIFEQDSKRLIGASIFGHGAGDLISELALALEMDCEAGDLALTIHPHPTLSETLPLAAERFEGTITDLMPRPRR